LAGTKALKVRSAAVTPLAREDSFLSDLLSNPLGQPLAERSAFAFNTLSMPRAVGVPLPAGGQPLNLPVVSTAMVPALSRPSAPVIARAVTATRAP